MSFFKKQKTANITQARQQTKTLEQALLKIPETADKRLVYLNKRLFLVQDLTADYDGNEFLKWAYTYRYSCGYETLDQLQTDTMLSIIEHTALIKLNDIRHAPNKNEIVKAFNEFYSELDERR